MTSFAAQAVHAKNDVVSFWGQHAFEQAMPLLDIVSKTGGISTSIYNMHILKSFPQTDGFGIFQCGKQGNTKIVYIICVGML